MIKKLILPALLLLIAASACTLFFMVPLKITAYSPEEEIVLDPGSIAVSVTFSAEVDPIKGELAFSLSEGGTVMDGTYTWNGRRLSFTPYKPYILGETYTLTVKQTAEDRYGNSLEKEFSRVFKTGSDDTRPRITAFSPADEEVITDLFTPILFTFSEAVDAASFYEAFSLSPAVEGTFTWSGGGTACTFTPLTAYTWQTEYLVSIAPLLKDTENNTLAEEHRIHFNTGADTDPPLILQIENLARSLALTEDLEDDAMYTLTPDWESNFALRIEFNEALDTANFPGLLQFEPPWSFDVQWNDPLLPTVAIIEGNELFTYGTIYTLHLASGIKDQFANETITPAVYHFQVNGPLTAPPAVTRVTYRTQPAGPISPELTPYSSITLTNFNGGQEGFFDIYIDLAQGAVIDPFSFMEAFLITDTNNCASFLITRLETGTYTDPQPAPAPDPGLNETVVRLYLGITDTAAKTGLVTLKLTTALQDTGEIPMAEDWELILVEVP